jgi:hypothetical protein
VSFDRYYVVNALSVRGISRDPPNVHIVNVCDDDQARSLGFSKKAMGLLKVSIHGNLELAM